MHSIDNRAHIARRLDLHACIFAGLRRNECRGTRQTDSEPGGQSGQRAVSEQYQPQRQYFINYNLPDGTYFTSAPINTVNWKANGRQQWTVPLGGGVGKIVHFGRLPVNMQLSASYNVVRPDNTANWQICAQLQFLFPK